MFKFFSKSEGNTTTGAEMILPDDVKAFAEKLAGDLGEIQSMPIPGKEGWFVMDNVTAREAEEKGASIFDLSDMIHCVVYAGKDVTEKKVETAQYM